MSLRTLVVPKENIPHLALFMEDIERVWTSRGGGPGIADALLEKLKSDSSTFQILEIWEGEEPLGLAWVETITEHYGNMVLHALREDIRVPLAEALVEKGWLKMVFSELVQFDDTSDYYDTFVRLGLHENTRQRMSLDLSVYEPVTTYPKHTQQDMAFVPMTLEHKLISSEISYLAHQVSRDYAGYPDLENLDRRIGLEQMVYDNVYGPIVPEASLFLSYQDYAVGSCMVIELPCWGYERVPWIFDMCIHPHYHGQGFGRCLLQESLRILKEQGFPVVGLAVTLSNTSAIALYESLGFALADYFSEFAELSS